MSKTTFPLPLLMLLGLLGCTTVNEIHAAGVGDAPNTLTVVGTGEVLGAPDIARLTLGVETRSSDPQQAVNESSMRTAAVVEALKRAGVDEKDLQTSAFNIRVEEPRHPMPAEAEPAPLSAPPASVPAPRARPGAADGASGSAGGSAPGAAPAERRITYVVNNSVTVVLRDLRRIGQTLTDAVGAGANHAWGIQFEREDPKPLIAEASAKAVQEARARAQVLAQQSGAKLGRVLSVVEGGSPAPLGYGYSQEGGFGIRAATMAAQAAPIEQGQIQVQQSVRVTFELR